MTRKSRTSDTSKQTNKKQLIIKGEFHQIFDRASKPIKKFKHE